MLCFFCLSLKCLASGRLDSDYSGICTIAKSNLNPLASGRLDQIWWIQLRISIYLNPLASGRLDEYITFKSQTKLDLNPLASGRLDVYDNDNYDMVSDLNPLASGRLDTIWKATIKPPHQFKSTSLREDRRVNLDSKIGFKDLNPLASGRLDIINRQIYLLNQKI